MVLVLICFLFAMSDIYENSEEVILAFSLFKVEEMNSSIDGTIRNLLIEMLKNHRQFVILWKASILDREVVDKFEYHAALA